MKIFRLLSSLAASDDLCLWWMLDISLGCRAGDLFLYVMMLNYTTRNEGGHRVIHQGDSFYELQLGAFFNLGPLRSGTEGYVFVFFSPSLSHRNQLASTNTPVCHELLEGICNSFIHGESLWWCQLVPSLLSHWKLMEAATGGGGRSSGGGGRK
ncbi:hypothetical protein AMECASPLE_003802 [Ameca splendens]|uniref:Uncharacterized protein n=1 Tax=Ameca splendens TaxID=208324 RepID=A0ABV0ZJL9_9TELE